MRSSEIFGWEQSASRSKHRARRRMNRLLRRILFVACCAFIYYVIAEAQEVRPRRINNIGISTERLSTKDLARWRKLERLIQTDDPCGQALYPTLRSLWDWLTSSSHLVQIELVRSTPVVGSVAGNFRIERFDPSGKRHIAVLTLSLNTIDRALSSSLVARLDGFIPLAGLDKDERYAEVLGHEMAHAVHILSDIERAAKSENLIEQTNELLLSSVARRAGLTPELLGWLNQRDEFLGLLEQHAQRVEVDVWRELRNANMRWKQKAQAEKCRAEQ